MTWLINLIRAWFCHHEYKMIHQGRIFDHSVSVKMPICYEYIYLCRKCAHTKRVKT